ncbi:Aspartic proteinase nepenthesin-2 precursor, putative [Ricinus communis]|uniref:Aspartic proteinase nepenthesin-2, putative n=1 Tax=Ricinus communis TaxID=3988 RepID=B9RV48_RICCO|nr:Aspartic proteinase nepenthesin-2 precursor, putative [Ricinus communis]|eukprot:XP_002517617.1 probable aspartic protease At2g35615 [Ricinus communis]
MAAVSSIYVSLFIAFISMVSAFSLVEARNAGFSANLIHRDSSVSPLYNPRDTYFDRLRNSFHRSISRANRFKPNSISARALVQSDIVPGGGEYLMRISIGNPQVEILAIADTGSDLIWVQCQPCEMCYKQNSPIFDPRRSSSYRNVLCGNEFCNKLDGEARSCDARGFVKTCGYTYSYGDQSFSDGHLAIERFGIGSTNSNTSAAIAYFQEVAFGCGTKNGGTFDELGSGIIGLGGGSMSLVSQLGPKLSGKFSYCLVPTSEQSNYTSKINFGNDINISGSNYNVVSTPLLPKKPETYYYLTLEAISVENKRLPYTNLWNGEVEKGNIIIDSGTTLTFLDSEFFNNLDSAVEEAVKGERVSDPHGLFNICFKDEKAIELPIITAHFTGADVELQPVNTFAKVEEDLLCFTMIPSNDIAIFGNLAQMNFLVGYDLEKKAVSFLPTDCTKQ